jgi:hypothetical protein
MRLGAGEGHTNGKEGMLPLAEDSLNPRAVTSTTWSLKMAKGDFVAE